MISTLLRSNLLKSAGIYTFSRLINSAVPFLMIPVLTRYLTPSDYGIVAMFSILIGIATPFVGLNVHAAISVKYFDRNRTDLPKYIGNCFYLLFISTAIFSAAAWLFSGTISSFTAFPGDWLWAVVLVSFGQFFILVLMTLWQAEDRPVRYGIYQNLQTLTNIVLSVLLVVALAKGWQGRIEAQIITIVLFAITGCILLYRNGWLKLSYDRSYMNHALKFGIPLIPHVLGAMLITQTDRILIANMVSIADAGIYTIGFQLANVIELLASSFNQAYAPWLYRHLSDDDFSMKKRIVKLTYLYFVLILVFAVFFAVAAPWFLSFFVGRAFLEAGRYIVWLAVGFSFCGMYYMVANYIFFSGRTAPLAWVTFFTAAINILFTYLLIKKNGPIGAAQASALAFFISFLMTWLLSAAVYKMPWDIRRLFRNEA